MTTVRHKRASAENPGKHGARDWRVTFDGKAPTHSEIVFMVGFLLMAEDRYPKFGRYQLWYFLDRLWSAKSAARISELADEVDATVEEKSGLKVVA